MEYKTTKIGNLVDINQRNLSKDMRIEYMYYLDTGNITRNRVDEIKYFDVKKDKIPSRARRIPKEKSILYSTVRPNQEHYGYLDGIDYENLIVSTGFVVIDVYEEIANSKYIYYFLTQNHITDYLQKIAETSVSTYPSIKPSDIEQLSINLPLLSYQNKVVSILSSFDKKIETNNKIIENLETQAQAIFKSWFFDFEPFQEGEFVESEFGMIPEGWEVVPVKEMSQSVITGKTPSTKNKEYFGNFMPFIKIPDMHNKVYTITTDVYLSEKGVQSQKNKTLPKNSICVSCIATVGLVNLVLEESQTNQQINSIIPAEGISPYYLYFAMKNLYDYLNSIASGSTQKNINKNDFERIKIINPNHKIMDRYHYFSKPLFELIKNLQLQNQNLAQLRDTLLPKLMSGEIRVGQDEVEEIENPL
jgi:type I restriction enzyme S subunit